MSALKKKLWSDTDRCTEELSEEFVSTIITKEREYRQTNANIENVFKALRGYCDEQINNPISQPFSGWSNLETSSTRFIFRCGNGQVLSLMRVKTVNEEG